jgi:hypothetical protein
MMGEEDQSGHPKIFIQRGMKQKGVKDEGQTSKAEGRRAGGAKRRGKVAEPRMKGGGFLVLRVEVQIAGQNLFSRAR